MTRKSLGVANYFYRISLPRSLKEGPDREGVKWELGFAHFFGWENGISCTGTGIHQQENNRKWEWD